MCIRDRITPGNTVSREDAENEALNSERSTARSSSEWDSESGQRLTSTHMSHTFTYAPYGPPRYTLLVVLQGASDSESLWPPWAAAFHTQLRALCPDVAPGMQPRRHHSSSMQQGAERAMADPAQPAFREIRPVRHASAQLHAEQ